MILLSHACLVNQSCGVFHFMTVENVIEAINHQDTSWHFLKHVLIHLDAFCEVALSFGLRGDFSSSPATAFFFVCSSGFYHTGIRDLPNLMRGLAYLRSLFHLRMQFLMPGVKLTAFSGIHLKLAAELVIFKPDLGPRIRARKPDRIGCSVL